MENLNIKVALLGNPRRSYVIDGINKSLAVICTFIVNFDYLILLKNY